MNRAMTIFLDTHSHFYNKTKNHVWLALDSSWRPDNYRGHLPAVQLWKAGLTIEN